MEKCSLDLIFFYNGQLDYLFFWLGMDCFPLDETKISKIK